MASCSKETEEDTDLSLWKCPLCLDIFKSPKLLPCSHTFCKVCLQNLVNHRRHTPGAEFDCPSCREKIRIPAGGVDAFKTNYYLEAARTKEKQQLLCKVHADKSRELELYCHQCNSCICLKCKLDEHSDHPTETLEDRSQKMKVKMTSDMRGLTSTLSGLKGTLSSFTAEQKAARQKREAVERDIQKRHRIMVATADKCRDDALFSLDTVTASIESQLEGVISGMQKTVDSLEKLRKRIEKCLNGEEGSGLMVTAQDIYQDASGQEKEVQQMLVQKISTVSRPVLRFSTTVAVTTAAEKEFLSGVERMDMPVNNAKVDVEQMFTSAQAGKAHGVYSLFPRSDDKIWVAYEDNSQCPQLFTFQGELTDTERSVTGRTNFTHTNLGTGLCNVQTPGSFQTYAKSRSLIKLKNHLNGTGDIMEVVVKNENPVKTSTVVRFTIRCGSHRAFDVHEDKALYAVVEEHSQRKVHIYQQPKESPVATYASPVQPFQPADVCFYKLGGHSVLLVADELNDAIHVVELETGQLVFGGYLAAGSPLIVQPMALSTDFKGRLWIACRSGAVLLCTCQ